MQPVTLIGYKQCPRCKRILSVAMFSKHSKYKDGLRYWCKECVDKYSREYKKANRDLCTKYNQDWKKRNPEKVKIAHSRNDKSYAKKHPERRRAINILYRAIKSGKIKRQPCIVCGNPKSQGHHEKYSKPLEVQWVCQTHHLRLHQFYRDFNCNDLEKIKGGE